MSRPTWDNYFMKMAYLASERSTCLRRKVGAVLVLDRNVLATGYNGAPAGTSHCKVTGCLREAKGIPSGERHEICRGCHAEQNAIAQAAKRGTAVAGAEVYCTNMPCIFCAKLMINSGIVAIYYCEGYGDDLAMNLLNEAGVAVIQLPKEDGNA